MIISLIVAISNNQVIGNSEGGIPWDLPKDSAHFRNYTAGKWMLLGRKTYQEMEGWFSDQTPLVLTRSSDLEVPRGHSCSSVENGIEIAREKETSELVVCGGAQVYKLALCFVEKMMITRVDTTIENGILFPMFDRDKWELLSEETVPADSQNEFQMTFQSFTRR